MPMPYNVLLLPLLAGYLLASWFRYARFYTSRQSGQRLIFVSSLFGLGLLVLSFVIIIALNRYFPAIGQAWRNLVPFAYVGHGALSLLLSIVFAVLGNLISDENRALQWAMSRSSTDSMERLLYRAAKTSTPVQLTLKSGKIYIGHIARVPPIRGRADEYLEILPILSGYRETQTHLIRYTVDYIDIILSVIGSSDDRSESNLTRHLDKDDVSQFIKVLPVADVSIVSMFHDRNIEEDQLDTTEVAETQSQ